MAHLRQCVGENVKEMDIVAFLVDITSHLNELNLKLQGQDNSVCDLMTAVHAFQRKLGVFEGDLLDCTHFPSVQEQVMGEKSDFVDKLIGNSGKHLTISPLDSRSPYSFKTNSLSQISEGSQRKPQRTSSGQMESLSRWSWRISR